MPLYIKMTGMSKKLGKKQNIYPCRIINGMLFHHLRQ